MTHGASILLDLGTYGPKFTKHRRHQCVYYLFYRGVVYFWELLEIESNETPEDTDEQTAAQAKTWGNQVLEKLEAIVQELLIHGVLPVAIVADNGSVPQYAIKRVLDKWPFIYQVRCGVHTLMLVVKRLGRLTGCVKFPPFCQLEDFVSRLCQASEMEHCPRIGGEVELGVLCTRVCFQERARRKDATSHFRRQDRSHAAGTRLVAGVRGRDKCAPNGQCPDANAQHDSRSQAHQGR